MLSAANRVAFQQLSQLCDRTRSCRSNTPASLLPPTVKWRFFAMVTYLYWTRIGVIFHQTDLQDTANFGQSQLVMTIHNFMGSAHLASMSSGCGSN